MGEWYQITNVAELDSPQLVVFEERVRHNIAEAIRMTGDVGRLRPHVKTNKTPEVVRMMIDAGVGKFKCATIEEAEMLAQEQARDVLLAYQAVGPKLARLDGLIKKYPSTRFSCLVDHEVAARAMSAFFSAQQRSLEVFIDLNVGMNRTGIIVEEAGPLIGLLDELPGIQLRGLHAYDGHFRDPDIARRKQMCDNNFRRVEGLASKLEASGMKPEVIAGGSPTFPVHAQRRGVDCSPGTFVFWDKGYGDICPEQHFLPAAVVVSRVISLPEPGKVCIDMGHKSIAAENDISKRAWFINEPEAKLLSQSEEHGVMAPAREHVPGDILYVMPYHVCPTVNLYSNIAVVRENRVAGYWRVGARH
jgi:D-serine deaminase-like pyridoxal phosphate-dependent protein